MKHFSHSIVKFRIPILIVAIVLLIPSFFSYISTKVNYDILYYLPDSIDTMKGQDILMDEFGKGAYAILVFEDMNDKDVSKTLDKIKNVDQRNKTDCRGSMLPFQHVGHSGGHKGAYK